MRQLILSLLALAALLGAEAANNKPFTIPELRQWKGAEGVFVPATELIISYSSAELEEVAQKFADDYLTMFGVRIETMQGKAKPGCFHIALKADKKLGSEGYAIDIDKSVRISAPTATGAYWATRTLLQMSEQTNARTLPKGRITDWPDYPMRGFTFDVGRKYIPMSYLKNLVKVMSYYKMNTLRVHLNDNGFTRKNEGDWDRTYSAFRMESERFPGLTARDGFYTKAEFRDFQKEAAALNVEIIPEFDVPSHSLAFTKYRPELARPDLNRDHLDLFNPATMAFVDSLFDEYLGGPDPVFTGKRMHIGTDEYITRWNDSIKRQQANEKFRGFTDRMMKLVKSYGKQPVAWGSLKFTPGTTPVEANGAVIDLWSDDFADPEETKAQGFMMYSVPDGYTYIVPAAGYYYDYLNTEMLYNKWTPAVTGRKKLAERDPQLLGGGFAVWNDNDGNGVTVKDIHNRIMPAMQVIAVKTWDGPSVTIPFKDYDKARQLLSEAPGVNELARIGSEPGAVLEIAELHPGQSTPLTEIGQAYSVEFQLTATQETPGTALFTSPNATFWLADPVEGKLGYSSSDGYLNSFNFRPYPGESIKVRVEGDQEQTSLFINGKLVEKLGRTAKYFNTGKKDKYFRMPVLRTLVFPLERAGNFAGNVENLTVYNYKVSERQ